MYKIFSYFSIFECIWLFVSTCLSLHGMSYSWLHNWVILKSAISAYSAIGRYQARKGGAGRTNYPGQCDQPRAGDRRPAVAVA